MGDVAGRTVRVLASADTGVLEDFLAAHADTSLFLRSNLRAGGIVDRGEPYQATWAGAFEGGRIAAVAAHCWNGNLLLQAPGHLDIVVRCAIAASSRAVVGLIGRWAQLRAARVLPGMPRVARLVSRSILMGLDLRSLRVPAALGEGPLVCRPLRDADVELATTWRIARSEERRVGKECRL